MGEKARPEAARVAWEVARRGNTTLEGEREQERRGSVACIQR